MEQIAEALYLDWHLILTQFFGFIILLFLLNQFVFKKVYGVLEERRDNIKQVYDQLDADRAAMEETRRQYEQRLADIEAEAREKIQAAVKEAQGLRDNLVSDARAQAESIVTQGRSDSERERQQAFLEMRQQIVALAIGAAGKVIGENLNDARHTSLVDDFIGSVGSGAIRDTGRGVAANSIGKGAGNSGGNGAGAYSTGKGAV